MTEWDKLEEEVIRTSLEYSYVRKSDTSDYWEAKHRFEVAVLSLADYIYQIRDP